jgi:putative ABC transport system ATP-binding protein
MELFIDLHASGQTVIVVTHEPDIALYAHRVTVVRDGKVVEDRRQAPQRGLEPPPPADAT